jgi:hypothetical protein
MSIDLPQNNAVVRQPFIIAGWALDLAAADNGIDVVHAWLLPAGGGAPIFAGAASVNVARPDVAGLFGANHAASGYGMIARGIAPGDYTLVVFAHSSYGAGFVLAQTASIHIASSTMLALDAPGPNAIVSQRFLIGGWTADFAAVSGGGIDLVNVYAYPLDPAGSGQLAGAPVFLGQAPVNVLRPDVGAYFGAQFGRTGFNIFAPVLPSGRYRVVAFGRSLVSGTFAVAGSADVILR